MEKKDFKRRKRENKLVDRMEFESTASSIFVGRNTFLPIAKEAIFQTDLPAQNILLVFSFVVFSFMNLSFCVVTSFLLSLLPDNPLLLLYCGILGIFLFLSTTFLSSFFSKSHYFSQVIFFSLFPSIFVFVVNHFSSFTSSSMKKLKFFIV